ncbi:abhd13, partial [Symbiodinium necroappetens]
TLYLDFVGCENLTDVGMKALAESLPETLAELELHFVGSFEQQAAVFAVFARAAWLKVTYAGTRVNRNFASRAELRAFADRTDRANHATDWTGWAGKPYLTVLLWPLVSWYMKKYFQLRPHLSWWNIHCFLVWLFCLRDIVLNDYGSDFNPLRRIDVDVIFLFCSSIYS